MSRRGVRTSGRGELLTADIAEHLLRAGERRLGVDDPFGPSRRQQMRGKAVRIGQRLERGAEAQLAVIEGVVHGGQGQAAEQAGQHANRQEEPLATGDPPGAIRREAAAGDDAMEMVK